MSTEKQSLKEIINFRMQKLDRLREAGVDPFPHNLNPQIIVMKLKINLKF